MADIALSSTRTSARTKLERLQYTLPDTAVNVTHKLLDFPSDTIININLLTISSASILTVQNVYRVVAIDNSYQEMGLNIHYENDDSPVEAAIYIFIEASASTGSIEVELITRG